MTRIRPTAAPRSTTKRMTVSLLSVTACLWACLLAPVVGQTQTDTSTAEAGEKVSVTLYKIWGHKADKKDVPRKLEPFEKILLTKTKLNAFQLAEGKQPSKIPLELNQTATVPLDKKKQQKVSFQAVKDANKCVLKVVLEVNKKTNKLTIHKEKPTIILLPIEKEGAQKMLLLVEYKTGKQQ